MVMPSQFAPETRPFSVLRQVSAGETTLGVGSRGVATQLQSDGLSESTGVCQRTRSQISDRLQPPRRPPSQLCRPTESSERLACQRLLGSPYETAIQTKLLPRS